MKLHALTALAAFSALTSCYMYPPRPPGGPGGYPLDRGPGDRRYGDQQAPGPRDTRYLDPAETTGPADPNSANVQAPDPNAPVSPDTVTNPTDAGNSTAPNPIVVSPDKKPEVKPPAETPNVAPKPAPTTSETPRATRTKPGFVKSPFDPLGREIDVSDMRSGQKARCPYTQKVFIVP
jgi:hypothetical protein